MAIFETFGLDDDLIPDDFEASCPVCGKPVKISLERDSDIVICPSCNTEIEIESI